MYQHEGPPVWDGDFMLLGTDPVTGRSVWARENEDGSWTCRTDYPVDDIIRANTEERNSTAGELFGDWRRVASVPLNAYYGELAEAQNQRDDKYIGKWLDDNSAFKTFEPRKAR